MAKKRLNKNSKSSYWGFVSLLVGIIILISIISFFFNWKMDQSKLLSFYDELGGTSNILGKIGSWIGHILVFRGFGILALCIPVFLIGYGLKKMMGFELFNVPKYIWHALFFTFWIPITFALLLPSYPIFAGIVGCQLYDFLHILIGKLGVIFYILLCIGSYIYYIFKIEATHFKNIFAHKSTSNPIKEKTAVAPVKEDLPIEVNTSLQSSEMEVVGEPEINQPIAVEPDIPEEDIFTVSQLEEETQITEEPIANDNTSDLEVTEIKEETILDDQKANKLVSEFGEFDPTLELGNYQFPRISLLADHGQNKLTIDQSELEKNKNRIVETLRNYKIEIAKIKATIGPTVTLYEIVPAAGVRISKIKNLEDDIALSLSAEGIRIIAPIPGKGTIGIEVANENPSTVSMKSVISSEKFQTGKMALPIAFGKTISNVTFVADLAKMPHLLMAGATGQGKSVGINAILTSLLYKRHPSELKFVLVDPKKVELTLYNKIERHFLAKLPNSDEAIITDTTKVVHTLNSLCIEMDNRYELLKDAMVRNISEYNEKFKNRKLNPENGHQFLPYIVLVIDEFADLIMTAGKEVETPIARLAQLARAIGIHLIVATQRPSVNVITGIIKANFPARLAFRVTSKIDSRTILDAPGADQLIGRGDMLLTTGNDITRIQCAFVDTPEVEKIAEFIGGQKGYPSALLLPEYEGEDSSVDVDTNDLDKMFVEAARLIVTAQQGSASLLQRKLKLGYNRAGRIIDQLEAVGIVGQFEGSKARQVLVPDEMSLEELLRNNNIL